MSQTADTLVGVVAESKRRSLIVDLLVRLVKEKPLGTIGGVIVLLLLITGIFANFLAPYGFNEFIAGSFLKAPSAQHILGTDNVGRDILSRIIYGARVSMIVGLSAACIDVLVATIIGTLSGFIGGKFDLVVQRFVDAFMCFPGLILLVVLMSLLGSGMLQVILVLGFVWGIGGSRIVRGAVIGIKQNVYVEAARAIGCSTWKLMIQHVLPNIMAPIIILFTIAVGGIILAEASLSFLGYGIPPPTPSWGGMLSGAGRYYMLLAPWMVIWPGLALTIVVFGINMLGDAMRDLLDPRLRGGVGRYGGVKVKKLAAVGIDKSK
jgi:peptide/nickel transport system permease protein